MTSVKKDLIVTLADANLIAQAKQFFSAIYFNAGWNGDYLLLTHNLPKEDRAWFEEKGILVYDAPLLSELPISVKKYPPIILSKLYLFQTYFKKWRKIIFLDTDTLVRASLNDLLALDGFSATRVTTFKLKGEFIADQKRVREKFKEYNLNGPAFSSAVFTFDTELIAADTFSKLQELYLKNQDLFELGEESTLNVFFYNHWRTLSIIYNSIPWYLGRFYGLKRNKMLAIILHFPCYKIKPWDKRSPYYREWLNNFQRADQIDLNRPLPAVRIFSEKEISSYQKYLNFKASIYFSRVITFFVKRQIGRVGLYLRKKNLKLYRRLVRLKNSL